MDKRYQVFVSSTYADLKEERQHVLQALMEMDCIPAGMELFPAADEEQWAFIKKIIDDCDYYLLIIGGRYGSTTSDGISYTEKEFDYAVSNGIKVIALIHGNPDDIPFGKSESNPDLRNKLYAFRDKVMIGRLVKFWNSVSELPVLVSLSLTMTIKMYPAIGWVRANHVANEDILSEINQLRKENLELRDSIKSHESRPEKLIGSIANFESNFTIHGSYYWSANNKSNFEITISWRDIFSIISPYLIEHPNDTFVQSKLAKGLLEKLGKSVHNASINEQEFKTISIQLRAYGLVTTNYTKTIQGGMALFWTLTKKGEQIMIENRVVR
jgi:hypothetical protein